MNKTTIDWPCLTHTWNPGYGCKRGCFYCYARDLHNKRRSAKLKGRKLPKQYYKPFEEIQYFPERLRIPQRSKVIKKVFVGDMSDICYWDGVFLNDVLYLCKLRPWIEFMFLTKDPAVYTKHKWPDTCWLGYTICGCENDIFHKILRFTQNGNEYCKLFLSIEPIQGPFPDHGRHLPLST